MLAPRPVMVVAVLLMLAGAASIAVHWPKHWSSDAVGFVLVNAIGILCGVLLLRRRAWARWIAAVWLLAHVAIGALNSARSAVLHALLVAICLYALFCREATTWFRGESLPTS
jgi:hypothetical protein